MNKFKKTLDKALGWFLIVLMAVLVINVLWQVFTRFVLDNPSSFTDELARYLLIWVGLIGAAFVAGQKMHLAIDLLPTKLTGKSKIYLDIFIEICIALFSLLVMIIGGVNLVAITLRLHQTSAALGIPLGYVYLSIPISGIIIIVYTVLIIVNHSGSLSEENKNSNKKTSLN